LFDKCGSGNICLELLASSGARWLMTLFGLIANSSLIWITIRNKKYKTKKDENSRQRLKIWNYF
jgi:hypothetical protein